MRQVRKLIAPLLVFLLLAGQGVPAPLRPGEETRRSEGFRDFYDLMVTWQGGMAEGRYTVTGTVTNVWRAAIGELKLDVRLFDGGGAELGRASYIFTPALVDTGATLPYGLAITVPPGARGARLGFRFIYQVDDDEIGSFPVFRSFETDTGSPQPEVLPGPHQPPGQPRSR